MKTSNKKKPKYQKPELVKIALVPEESVLGACKNGVSSGPAGPNCLILACSADGS